MGLFSQIANGTFFQDVADAWSGDKPSKANTIYLSYPADLGQPIAGIGDNDGINYNSSPEISQNVSNQWANQGGSLAVDPFMLFEFFRLDETTTTANPHPQSVINKPAGCEEKVQSRRGIRSECGVTIDQFREPATISDGITKKTKRTLVKNNGRICLYMPAGVNISDSMNYDQQSRKLAAALGQVVNNGTDFKKGWGEEDALVLAAKSSGAIGTAIGGLLGKLGGGLAGAAVGGGGLGIGTDALADELLRRKGKVMNPNEFMQYQNTQLRSFSFQWKFLPDSAKESIACQDIIKRFRGSAHANRKSSITLSVPDQVVISFHGAKGFAGLPPLVITSTNVTYNPNSASFFEVDNTPVEIDFSVTLSEITPIYRDDVEERGY